MIFLFLFLFIHFTNAQRGTSMANAASSCEVLRMPIATLNRECISFVIRKVVSLNSGFVISKWQEVVGF